MGQQQLLLLVLVAVIVGIMTVVAINFYADSQKNSIEDLVRQEMIEAASYGQAYYLKPSAMGGGGNTFVGIQMVHIQLDTLTTVGRYAITERNTSYFKITADPISDIEDLTAVVYSNRIDWE